MALGMTLGMPLSVGSLHAEDEAPPSPPVSPFETQRARDAAAASDDEDAVAVARQQVRSPDVTKRLQAWHVLARARIAVPFAMAMQGARDSDARVAALAAGEVWRGFAIPKTGVVLGDPEPETATTRRVLGAALREVLDRTPVDVRPAALFHSGRHVASYLQDVALHADTPVDLRERVVGLLPRLGSARAADALLAVLEAPGSGVRTRDLYQALVTMRLTEAQRARLIRNLEHPGGGPRIPLAQRLAVRGFARGRDVEVLLALLARHGTEETHATLITASRQLLRKGRNWPPRLLAATRVLVSHGVLTRKDCEVILDRCDSRVHLRGREGELGALLHASEDRWSEDEAQVLLVEMLERADGASDEECFAEGFTHELLPSVEAWARFLVGEAPESLAPLAESLVFGTGREIPLWAVRHLGARLWRRLGGPGPDHVRRLLSDPDAWLRREALTWLSVLPTGERDAALAARLHDEDERVFLTALEAGRAPLSVETSRRALGLALTGTEGQRLRAWRAIQVRGWPEGLPPQPRFTAEPAPEERVDLAAAIHEALGKGSGEGLPPAGDR